MQRGAQIRDRESWADTPTYTKPPVFRNADKLHFGSDDEEILAFADKLRPTIESYAKNGFRKPVDVSRLLNKNNVRTQLRDSWNPRLCWFLLDLLFGNGKNRKLVKSVILDTQGNVKSKISARCPPTTAVSKNPKRKKIKVKKRSCFITFLPEWNFINK